MRKRIHRHESRRSMRESIQRALSSVPRCDNSFNWERQPNAVTPNATPSRAGHDSHIDVFLANHTESLLNIPSFDRMANDDATSSVATSG